jgi:uncharacterized membrane protein YfcA
VRKITHIEFIIYYFCIKINLTNKDYIKNIKNLLKNFKTAQNTVMSKIKNNKSSDSTSPKIDKSKGKQTTYAIITGALAGLINGLFGGGGGMIVVPMITTLLKCPPKKAHATAILIILPLSIVSGLFYLSFGVLNVGVAIPTGIGVIIGGGLGALLLSKISNKWLVIVFSAIMAIAGLKLLIF